MNTNEHHSGDFDTELGYIFGFVILLLATVLSFAFLPYPWDAVVTLIIGGITGYLLKTLVSYIHGEETQ